MMPTSEPTGEPTQVPSSGFQGNCANCAASCHTGFAAKLGADFKMTIFGAIATVYGGIGASDDTVVLEDNTANTNAVPKTSMLVQPTTEGGLKFEYEDTLYTFGNDDIIVLYSSDITMIGSKTALDAGTKKFDAERFDVTQINYDFTFSAITMTSEPALPLGVTYTPLSPLNQAKYQYTIVKDGRTGTAFRVLTGSTNEVTGVGVVTELGYSASPFLNGFRAYLAPDNTGKNQAYCTNEMVTDQLANGGIFKNPAGSVPSSYDAMQTNYEALLTDNGWSSDGTVVEHGPAYCFDSPAGIVHSTNATVVCEANNVDLEMARFRCVKAIAWLVDAGATSAPDSVRPMIDACAYDYCSFGVDEIGARAIIHHYQVEAFAQRQIDPLILNNVTADTEIAEGVTETVVERIQEATMTFTSAEAAQTIMDKVPEAFIIGWAKATGCLTVGGEETCSMTVTINGLSLLRAGVTVSARADLAERRNTEIVIQYTALMPTAIATAVEASGVVVTAAMLGESIAQVINNDPAAFEAAYPAASQVFEDTGGFTFQAVTAATTVTLTFAGGSVSPTSAPETHESELDLYLLIVGLVGGVAIIALIVLTVVKCQLSNPPPVSKPRNDESRVEVGLQPSTDTTAGSEPAKGFELTQVPTEQI